MPSKAPAKKTKRGSATQQFTPKADPDAKLTKAQLAQLHDRLIEERDRLMAGMRRHVSEAVEDDSPLADEADLANRNANQAYLLRFADKERKLLREVQHALRKMETGEYGLCEGTEEPIGFKRLQIRPWTRYSIQHKEELERQKAQQRSSSAG